jgi:hypothetical protein
VVHVNEGTLLAGTIWRLTGSGTFTIGVTALTFKPLDFGGYAELSCRYRTAGSNPSAAPAQQNTDENTSNGVSTNGVWFDCVTWTDSDKTSDGILSPTAGQLVVGPGGAGDYLVEFEGLCGNVHTNPTYLGLWKYTAIGASSNYLDDTQSEGFVAAYSTQKMRAVVSLEVGDKIWVRGIAYANSAANFTTRFSRAVLRATRIKV